MLLPEATAEFLQQAALHAQFTVERVDLDDEVPGDGHSARLTATIVRVFRGDSTWVGRQTVVEVPCLVPGDEPPEGGTWWSSIEALRQTTVMEAYLSLEGENLAVVLGVTCQLEAPTDVAQLDEFGSTAAERVHAPRTQVKKRSHPAIEYAQDQKVFVGLVLAFAVASTVIWYLGRG